MKERHLVTTIAVGEKYLRMAEITHPSIQAYADKVGADFLTLKHLRLDTNPSWEKLQTYDLIERYDRILLIDTDMIVRRDCPDLFSLVSPDTLGAFDEGKYFDRSAQMMGACMKYGDFLPDWCGAYYNCGLLVASRAQRELFKEPIERLDSYIEQGLLNLRIQRDGIRMDDVGLAFNHLYSMGSDRLSAYIIHYAGAVDGVVTVEQQIERDLASWKKIGL